MVPWTSPAAWAAASPRPAWTVAQSTPGALSVALNGDDSYTVSYAGLTLAPAVTVTQRRHGRHLGHLRTGISHVTCGVTKGVTLVVT